MARHLGRWMALAALSVGSVALVARGEEWPKWLGPEGTGISKETVASQWPEGGPKKLWQQTVGEGFSSTVARDGRVYFIGMIGSDDVLTALEADTGKVLWQQRYTVTHHADGPNALHTSSHLPVPEATPTIDGDRIYTYGGGGDLLCRRLADGKEVWKLNVLDATEAKNLTWNEASSPLVTDKFVYVQGGQGGAVAIAVDKADGKIAWKAESGVGGYAAPILADVAGKQQLIVFAGQKLFGLDPETGKTLWNHNWKTNYDVNAATPVYRDGKLFITTSYGHGCAMLSVGPEGAKEDWKGSQIASKFQPCILVGDRLYGNSGGRLKCLHWPDGKQIYSIDLNIGEGGSFIIAGSNLIALGENGRLVLVSLSEDGAKVASEAEVFHGSKIWSDPVIYHGKLYVKGKDELVCFDVGAAK